jgi:hypothetical protein
MAKPIVPFRELYGADPPEPKHPESDLLPPGSPYGVIGTSAVDIAEWPERMEPAWSWTKLNEPNIDDLEWIAVTSFSPTRRHKEPGMPTLYSDFQGAGAINAEGLGSAINERMGRYEELIPLKKYRGPNGELHVGPNPPEEYRIIKRRDGRPDTSWQAIVPADQPWHLQVLNAKKEVVYGSHGRTWSQVIPGEQRTDCQGCHAHWKPDPIPFSETFAATAEYQRHIKRLRKVKTVVWNRDIEPLGLGVPMSPWGKQLPEYPNFEFSEVRPFRTQIQDFDDNPKWAQHAELVRFWIDTGMMYAVARTDGSVPPPDSRIGPYRDSMPPTLVITPCYDRVVVGACDPWSGIDKSSLSVALDGVELVADMREDADEETWTLPRAVAEGTIVATVADNHGNVTSLERIITPSDFAEPATPSVSTQAQLSP